MYTRAPLLVSGRSLTRACPTLRSLIVSTCFAPFGVVPTGSWVDTAPIDLVFPCANVSVEARPRPVLYSLGQGMFPWIPMDVVHAPFEVLFIADGVLPVSSLPYTAIPMLPARSGLRQLATALIEPAFRKLLFDPHPTRRVSDITGRHRPDRMPMVGQKHNGYDFEKTIASDPFNRGPQAGPPEVRGEHWLAAVGDTSEEVGSPRNVIASKIRHGPPSPPDVIATRPDDNG